MFGFNINSPSVLTDQLPTLDGEMVRNLNALYAARKRFIEAESSEKNWRAPSFNVRTYAYEEFVTGVTVYYKR